MVNNYKNYSELPLTLSVPEVAAELGISRVGAYELVHSVSFPKVKIGKMTLLERIIPLFYSLVRVYPNGRYSASKRNNRLTAANPDEQLRVFK